MVVISHVCDLGVFKDGMTPSNWFNVVSVIWIEANRFRSKYYRQTLMFSSFQAPEINAVFTKSCQSKMHNFDVALA